MFSACSCSEDPLTRSQQSWHLQLSGSVENPETPVTLTRDCPCSQGLAHHQFWLQNLKSRESRGKKMILIYPVLKGQKECNCGTGLDWNCTPMPRLLGNSTTVHSLEQFQFPLWDVHLQHHIRLVS